MVVWGKLYQFPCRCCGGSYVASPTWSSTEQVGRPATKRLHTSNWRSLEMCCRPPTWWCNDATALVGYVKLMMICISTVVDFNSQNFDPPNEIWQIQPCWCLSICLPSAAGPFQWNSRQATGTVCRTMRSLPRLCRPSVSVWKHFCSRPRSCMTLSSIPVKLSPLLYVVKWQLTICFKLSKSIQIGLCMLMSLSIHLHDLVITT